jgi:hypothetical protein
VCRTVRPNNCDDGAVAPHADIPAMAHAPPAANQTGLTIIL